MYLNSFRCLIEVEPIRLTEAGISSFSYQNSADENSSNKWWTHSGSACPKRPLQTRVSLNFVFTFQDFLVLVTNKFIESPSPLRNRVYQALRGRQLHTYTFKFKFEAMAIKCTKQDSVSCKDLVIP